MNIHIEDIGPCRKQINIEVPASKVDETFSEIIKGYSKHARIPGFRPGKAPGNLVRRRFQKEILNEVKEHLIPQGYQAALAKEKLRTVQVVDVADVEPKEGQAYGFHVTVDVFPEFTLPDYKSIRIEEKPVEVTDDSVDEIVDRMRDRMATFADVSGRPAGKSDRVMVTYTATVDGMPMDGLVKEHGILAKAENFGVILDPDYSFIPEFAAGLEGASEGETKEIEVNFDDQFVEKALAGKKAVYTVQINKVQEKKLPEITEEFLKSVGAESIESMRTRIRADLLRMKTEQEGRRIQDEICKNLLENTTMNLPESELQRRTADEVYELVEYNSNKGIDRANIEQNREKIFEAAGKSAEEKLKLRYILLNIARDEKLEVSEADVEARIRLLAHQARKDAVKLKDELIKNNRIGMLRDDMMAAKALELLQTRQKPAESAV